MILAEVFRTWTAHRSASSAYESTSTGSPLSSAVVRFCSRATEPAVGAQVPAQSAPDEERRGGVRSREGRARSRLREGAPAAGAAARVSAHESSRSSPAAVAGAAAGLFFFFLFRFFFGLSPPGVANQPGRGVAAAGPKSMAASAPARESPAAGAGA